MSARPMSIERRLIEYAEWQHLPGPAYGSGRSVFARIRDDQHNAGQHGAGFRADIIDGLPCRPDGGIGAQAERLGAEIARDNRCRELRGLIPLLPQHHRAVLESTYIGPPREVPRSEREAAQRLGIPRGEYIKRKAALMGWFEGALLGRAA